ncbi:unnamed protein product [Lepeophtheirus salmonis]|uniref:(salmon louse) hypothetical protein n=1 Tax=Lepeophtheirus salmonis TaxID=72036 RepID=A0A7R8CHF1_LEPSM|nr:unnamed protein product [Lepeophtheirus salmonis]CAF2823744.1 unnamed protein product [Lepeophtheirus salmonis]
MALYIKPNNLKSTLHYDTTSSIETNSGPALILIFSDKRRFSLRPLLFAYEDQENIIKLCVETYKRLASATPTTEDVSPKDLWQKTDSIMTDFVSKNLNIEQQVAQLVGSTLPPPNHLLVVECAIKSILNLASHQKSARSYNQADLFDFILQIENQVKYIPMYHEQRFTKLGYCGGSIIKSLPYLRMLLNETHLSNQHVEIVRLLPNTEFFGLINAQQELLKTFPQLYTDLLVEKLDTLKDCVIPYPPITVANPTSASPEGHLAEFGKQAAVARYRNKNFTAKGIRNDCALLLSNYFRKYIGKGFNDLVKVLNDMENKWYNEQKQILNIRIAEKIEMGKKKSQYTLMCFQLCKGWGGPATSVEELHQIIHSHPDMKKKIVRKELIYYRDTHKFDVLDNPTMFKVNKNLHEERLGTRIPTNRDAEVALECNVVKVGTEDDMEIEIGKYYAILITEVNAILGLLLFVRTGMMMGHPNGLSYGEWEVSNNRFMTFSLRNHNAINFMVEKASLQMVEKSS